MSDHFENFITLGTDNSFPGFKNKPGLRSGLKSIQFCVSKSLFQVFANELGGLPALKTAPCDYVINMSTLSFALSCSRILFNLFALVGC